MNTNIAVIPAYEPDERLLALLTALDEDGFDIIVVDDGSGESYRPIFALADRIATVITSPENHGKGHALKTAFAWIRDNYDLDSTIVVLDCDGQHTPEDVCRLSLAAEEHPQILYLGSRLQSKDSPLRSRLGNGITKWVYRLTTGLRVEDTQTGLRAFSYDLMERFLEIPGDRYEYEMNVLLQCARQKIPMVEIPIETIYIDGNTGSHFHAVRDSFRIYKQILAFCASSLLGFAVDYSLFSLLVFLTGGTCLLAANVAARVVSASVNFTVNRRAVFRDRGSLVKSALQYAALAVFILACNSALLYAMTSFLHWNALAAKLAAELTMFLFSWMVQRSVIFTNGSERSCGCPEELLSQERQDTDRRVRIA